MEKKEKKVNFKLILFLNILNIKPNICKYINLVVNFYFKITTFLKKSLYKIKIKVKISYYNNYIMDYFNAHQR